MAKFHSLQARFGIRDNRTPVIVYRNYKWSLNITLSDLKEFDVKGGKLTSHYRGIDKDEVNKTIQKRYQLINRLITEAIEKGVDSLQYIKSKLADEDAKLRKLNVTSSTKISEAFYDYMVSKGYNKDIEQGRTFDRYKSQYSRLKDFETVNKKKLGQLNLEWAKDYALFLATPFKKEWEITDEKNEREYTVKKTLQSSNNTITRYLIDTVAMCKYIMKGNNDITFPIDDIKEYVNKFALPHEDVDNIVVLSRKQWQDYKAYEPREKFSWEIRTFDLFRFCVNTGLRFSDAERLTDEFIKIDENGNETISMNAQKTRGKFQVPMNEDALRIFNKYKRDFRKKFPVNQQINANLRKIVQRIPSFNTEVPHTEYILNKVIQSKIPFAQKLSFHDSRKSFVSFLIANSRENPQGLLKKIMSYTGWTDIRTISHYLSVFSPEKSTSDYDTVNLI